MSRPPDEEVSAILRLVRLCESVHALPDAGGLLDQDSYFVYLYEQVLLADYEKQQLDDARAKSK